MMRTKTPRRAGLALLFALALAPTVLGACAKSDAGAPAASPAKNAERAGEPATDAPAAAASEAEKKPADVSPSTTKPQPAQPQPDPAPAPQAGSAPTDTSRTREAALRGARSEVDRAKRELELAMSDCMSACRALGSMERATGHLCDLATDSADRGRCEDARTTVLRAREKIRGTCTTCPGGPSLDKSAPIPSRP